MGVQYWNRLSGEEVKLKVTHVRRKNIMTAFGGGWASSGSHNLKCQQGATQYSCLKKSHGWRNLVGCSPWGHEESDMTERLHFHLGNKHKLLKHGEGKNKERAIKMMRLWKTKGHLPLSSGRWLIMRMLTLRS